MTRIAVFGSRQYPNLDDPARLVEALHARYGAELVLVSGGAVGVDTAAEQAGIRLGVPVYSLRPTKVGDDSFAIQLWHLGVPNPSVNILPHPHPTFADYGSACIYRDLLIAEKSVKGVAFHANASRGTAITAGFFRSLEKDCLVFSPEEPFAV